MAVFRLAAAIAALWPLTQSATAQSGLPVDLELVIAIDCSYSVDRIEFRLQLDGTAAAFRHPQTIRAILGGPDGRIAVTMVEWSSEASQVTVIPWTVIDSLEDARAFADRVEAAPRLTQDGGTSISGMIEYGLGLFNGNGFAGRRQVIDISSDGRNNSGRKVEVARGLAERQGVTVNGLTILTEHPTLNYYFEQRIIAGPDAFVEIANDYPYYADAIHRKLLREIEGLQVAHVTAQ